MPQVSRHLSGIAVWHCGWVAGENDGINVGFGS
jgi:hypothetical protein